MTPVEPAEFAVEQNGNRLAGETVGEGPPVVLLHGVSATRRYVVHESKVLARDGYRQLSYDARGHGRSDPAPEGRGYAYSELADDLDAVIAAQVGERRVLVAGHSMGAHTALAYALERADRLAGLVVIGPVYMGFVAEEGLAHWDRLADGLEHGGVDGNSFEVRAVGEQVVHPERLGPLEAVAGRLDAELLLEPGQVFT